MAMDRNVKIHLCPFVYVCVFKSNFFWFQIRKRQKTQGLIQFRQSKRKLWKTEFNFVIVSFFFFFKPHSLILNFTRLKGYKASSKNSPPFVLIFGEIVKCFQQLSQVTDAVNSCKQEWHFCSKQTFAQITRIFFFLFYFLKKNLERFL